MLTADTITDEQIMILFLASAISADTAHEATNTGVWPREREAARARCAEILNARHGLKTLVPPPGT